MARRGGARHGTARQGEAIVLLVDPRVGSEDLLAPLQRYGVPAEMSPNNMEAADFAFIGRGQDDANVYIGIELKETRDILSCLYTGRFTAEQIPKLQRIYGQHVWLVTEGIWRAGDGGVLESFHKGWHPVRIGTRAVMAADLDAWILTQTIRGGFHYHHCATRSDTIRFIATLYHWWTDKSLDEHRSHQAIYLPPPDRVMMIEPSTFLKMASCLPKVGWDKGMKLEAEGFRFRLLNKDGLFAEQKDLTSVDGIGKTIADQILTTLH